MNLIDLATARRHCRADASDDELLEIYGAAAEQTVQDRLNRSVYADAEALAAAVLAGDAGTDPMVVNDAIRAAVLLILGHLYRNREAVETGQGAAAVELPQGVQALLWPHRVGLGV